MPTLGLPRPGQVRTRAGAAERLTGAAFARERRCFCSSPGGAAGGCVSMDVSTSCPPQSCLARAVCIEHCIELSWNSFCAFFFCVPRLERQSHGASDAVSIGDPACKIGQSRVDTVMPTTACRLENSHRRGARHWRGNTRTPRQSHSVVTAGPNRTPSAAAAVTSGRPDLAGRPPPR